MRFKWMFLLIVAAATFFAGGWLLRRGAVRAPVARRATQAPTISVGSRLFDSVFAHVRSNALDSLDESSIYRRATAGMLDELSDPYAALVPVAETTSRRQGDPPVLGMHLDLVDGYVTVVSVTPATPAAEAGVRAGDVVLGVEKIVVDQHRPADVARLLAGEVGTPVRIRLGRAGQNAPIWVTVTRRPERAPPGPAVYSLADGVARIRLHRIDDSSAGYAGRVVDSLVTAGNRAVALDLRGVVGGRLEDAVRLADVFLGAGQAIVKTRGRVSGDSATIRSAGADSHPDLLLAVLVDRGTAGAAEVVAGALQDHDRGVVVGEPTFGRGVRLSLFPVATGTMLRLTTELWLTPSGRTIQRPVPGPGQPDSAPARPQYRTDGGRKVLGGGGIVPDREVTLGAEEGHGSDPALALARDLLVRAKSRRALLAALGAN